MSLANRKIKKICGTGETDFDTAAMANVIERSKAVFSENQTGVVSSRLEFLYQQSKYIKKGWWLAQAALLAVLWLVLKNIGSSFYLQNCVGITAPLFMVLVIPELWKNRAAGMMELECSTYYSLRQVYAARLICFALVDLVLLTLFFLSAYAWGGAAAKIPVGELIIQFFVPFNVTCCICFGCFYGRRRLSGMVTGLMCMVWAVLWVEIVLVGDWYEKVAVPVWVGLLALSTVYLAYCIARGQRRCEYLWEDKLLWNLN